MLSQCICYTSETYQILSPVLFQQSLYFPLLIFYLLVIIRHFRGGMVQQRTVPRAAGVRVCARSLHFSACIFAGMTNLHLLFAASETAMPISWSCIFVGYALWSPRTPGLSSFHSPPPPPFSPILHFEI